MWRKLKQTHKKDKNGLLSISWDDNVYTWRKQNAKHKNKQWSSFMIQKEMCLTFIAQALSHTQGF